MDCQIYSYDLPAIISLNVISLRSLEGFFPVLFGNHLLFPAFILLAQIGSVDFHMRAKNVLHRLCNGMAKWLAIFVLLMPNYTLETNNGLPAG